jgi:hypothetical protein
MIMIGNVLQRDEHGIHYDFDHSYRSDVGYSSDAASVEKFFADDVARQNQVVDQSHGCWSCRVVVRK